MEVILRVTHYALFYEFVENGTFVAMVSDDYREPLYFAKIIEKNIAKEDETLHDRFGHTIFPGQRYLSANYLKLSRSKKQHLNNIRY